uniref:Ion_trans_2 domain-containing protein n=1 Tax=Elaeophora elaphi TaxID=1147741 RepID=A0A0R3S5F4_9BILA
LFFAFFLSGYGNIAPKTFAGQIFCIFFASFGVPLTLLAIADLGKFISQIIFACNDQMSENNEQSFEFVQHCFQAVYFNFITLTSIGLGDIVPQRRTYMAITILYIIVGLALTTIAIEIAADTLKKLHYFKRKIENVGNIEIWFGGKRLTVRQIIRNLCDQFNVPETAISGFNITHFVEQAIKVEAGELPPLRTMRQEANVDKNGRFILNPCVFFSSLFFS